MTRCLDCGFFCTLNGDHADDLTQADLKRCDQGECWRNTPAVGRFRGEDESLEYDYGQWPVVLGCDWCGRFEPCANARHGAAQTRHVCAGSTIAPKAEDRTGT